MGLLIKKCVTCSERNMERVAEGSVDNCEKVQLGRCIIITEISFWLQKNSEISTPHFIFKHFSTFVESFSRRVLLFPFRQWPGSACRYRTLEGDKSGLTKREIKGNNFSFTLVIYNYYYLDKEYYYYLDKELRIQLNRWSMPGAGVSHWKGFVACPPTGCALPGVTNLTKPF